MKLLLTTSLRTALVNRLVVRLQYCLSLPRTSVFEDNQLAELVTSFFYTYLYYKNGYFGLNLKKKNTRENVTSGRMPKTLLCEFRLLNDKSVSTLYKFNKFVFSFPYVKKQVNNKESHITKRNLGPTYHQTIVNN